MMELTAQERQAATRMIEDADPFTRLNAHMTLARDSVMRADLLGALDLASKGLAIARDIRDDDVVAEAIMLRAAVLWDLQRFDEAALNYLDAAALYRQRGDVDTEGLAYLRLAWVTFQAGNYEDVFDHVQRAVDVYRNPADERLLANLIRLAEESVAMGQFELSLQCSELAIDIASGFDDEPMHWNARGLRLLALECLGRTDAAVALGRVLVEEGLAADSRDRTVGMAVLLMQVHANAGDTREAAHVGARLLAHFGARLTDEQRSMVLLAQEPGRRAS